MKPLRVIELFSGVGAQRIAFNIVSERTGLKFDFVAQCEIDKYAVKSYNAIHGETPNLGDITKVETLPECDILTWSFPCQSLSMAGKKEGMKEGTETESSYLPLEGVNGGEENSIRLTTDNSLGKESYLLCIDEKGVEIRGGDYGGVFNGVQSLLQLLPHAIYTKKATLPMEVSYVKIEDAPRFSYRGILLDVARTFQPVEEIKRVIDNMAYLKLNKLHFHLVDDQAWRVDLKKYPDFVKKGAYRGGDAMFPATLGSFDKKYGGYYTQDELRSIVAYATERNIEVIPEIDMPGHSRILGLIHPAIRCNYTPDTSATNGMDMRNVWCVAKESNYALIEDIVKELVEIFPSEYIHIGGDEVRFEQWDGCADCQNLIKKHGLTGGAQLEQFFVNRVSKILAKYNRKSMVWDEAVDGGLLPKSTLVCGWRKFGIGWQVSTKNGYPTIVMPGEFMYLNRKQSPYDRGHLPVCSFKTMCEFSFDNADATDEQRKHIAGIEAGFWSETHLVNITPDRHFSDYLEYMFFPRTLAVSELGWSKERRSFDEMISILKESFYYKLSAMGVTYRLEDPTIKVENGKIYASTTDGSELYYRDILTNKTRKYRTPIDASKASFTLFQSRLMTGYSEEVGAEEFYKPLTPKCTLTSSMPFTEKYPAEICASYEKAARITKSADKGDWVEWRFEEPLKCTYIKIATGVEHMRYCVINNGHLEVSYDGKTFVNVGALNDGGFELQPKNKPIYAIRIVSDGTNEAIGRTDIQPLIIK